MQKISVHFTFAVYLYIYTSGKRPSESVKLFNDILGLSSAVSNYAA